MFCTQCGNSVGNADRYCANCGSPLVRKDEIRNDGSRAKPPATSMVAAVNQPEPQSEPSRLTTSKEAFKHSCKEDYIVFEIPSLGYPALAPVSLVYTSERILFLQTDKSKWEDTHLVAIAAMGGPLGLLIASVGASVWSALSIPSKKKAFDGRTLDTLVQAGLALSASYQDCDLSVQQLNRGFLYPSSCLCVKGTFVLGNEKHEGRLTSIHVCKGNALARNVRSWTASPVRLDSPTTLKEWCKSSAAGTYLQRLGWKKEPGLLRNLADSTDFPSIGADN